MLKNMSWNTFIASDFQLEDVENPHVKQYSVNEALANGVSVPEAVLNSVDLDRNKPNVLLWIDDEKNFGDITIQAFDKTKYLSKITNLKYCSTLQWNYSEARAKQLIQYIQKHLEIADKIEIWNIWVGNIENEPTHKTYHIQIGNLMPTDFEKMSEYDSQCIEVTRGNNG